jgi:hypothetical protein
MGSAPLFQQKWRLGHNLLAYDFLPFDKRPLVYSAANCQILAIFLPDGNSIISSGYL